MKAGKDLFDYVEHGGAQTPQAPRASSGGVTEAKEMNYKPPKGPTNIMREGPGLGGTVHPCGSQGKC